MKRIFTLLGAICIGISSFAQNLQGDFEGTWRTYTVSSGGFSTKTLTAPPGWFGFDSLAITAGVLLRFAGGQFGAGNFNKEVFKSTDSYSGTNAVKLVTSYEDTLGYITGAISNAQPGINITALAGGSTDYQNAFSYTGGTPITGRVPSVSAYVKYFTEDTVSDYGAMVVEAVLSGQGANGADSVVGEGVVPIDTSMNTYTQITADILYNDATVVPDKLLIIFLSSAEIMGSPNSTLYVDSVTMAPAPLAVAGVQQEKYIKCYPNPTNGLLYIRSLVNDKMTWQIVSLNGQIITNRSINGNDEIDLSYLPAGLYFYNVLDDKGIAIQKGMITLAK